MKRPQLNGNKLVTRYSDTTSLALRNYIDISSQRLSKVRAGKHLVSVLQKDAPTRHHQTPDLPRLDDPLSMNGFSSHRSEKPATAGGKQIVLSDFMGTYLTQKNIDEDLLAKKEGNIYQFFKEKFGLMGKYLGEDVLKAGLGPKGSSQEGERPKKYKNVEYDIREHGNQKNEEKIGGEGGDDPASRIMNINREIMGIILKEEHAKEMEALMQLQTEQNMQVFNDLQDIGFKDNDRKVSSMAPTRSSPTKMILKNNFLRTFVEIIPESPMKTEEKFYSTGNGYRSNSKKTSAYGNRPQTDYLVFRTQQKKETVIPDMEKISNQFDSHKFGKKAVPHHTKNVPSNGGTESVITEDENAGKYVDKLKVPRAMSFTKLETPQPSMESVRNRNKTRVDTAGNTKENYSTAKSIKALIGEEIEFLNNNRDPNRQRASTAAEKVRIPSRFVKQVAQIENKHASLHVQENIQQETEPGIQKETSSSHRDVQTRESKRPVLQDTKKNVQTVSKSQTRFGAAFEESNPQLQGIRIMKKNVTYINPKTDNSFKFAVQTPVVKSFGSIKKEVKAVVGSSQQIKTKPDLNSLLEINSEKPAAFTTKFKAGKKEELSLPENEAMLSTQQFTGYSSAKANSKAFIFDQRSASGSNLLMKASFGNKYWKNTFNDCGIRVFVGE